MGLLLEAMAWPEAARALTPEAIVVLPVGAAAKEHGHHLPLNTDWRIAEALKARVLAATGPEVVVAPTLAYHHYPAFADYPGSTSLRSEVARDLTVDVCRSLARHGPRRCYALNTGVSTLLPLEQAAGLLAAEGVVLRYTDFLRLLAPVEEEVGEQEGGTHADELETSLLLHLDPAAVDMARARRDWQPGASGPLLRAPRPGPGSGGKPSPSGVWGDPTLATAAKGARAFEALVEGVLGDLAALRGCALPAATAGQPEP